VNLSLSVPFIRAIRVALLTTALALPSFATIVSGNLTLTNCVCGYQGAADYGIEFSSGAYYQLTSVEAYMSNDATTATAIDFFIYSNASDVPGTELTELTATVPAAPSFTSSFAGVVTSGAPLTPLTLDAGTNYWLVIDVPNESITWGADGSSSPEFAYESAGSWTASGPADLQYEVDGITPEPGTFAITAIGMALAALALRRR
jgi:hypothetical protein